MATILVVDDELGIRALLSEILTDEGHQVDVAANAAQARLYRQRVRPDMVLLDIWMPDTDGITLLKEWQALSLLTMPVVMMSGHGTIDTAVEATKLGACAFLEKPITLQKLMLAVNQALSKPAQAAGLLSATRGASSTLPARSDMRANSAGLPAHDLNLGDALGRGALSAGVVADSPAWHNTGTASSEPSWTPLPTESGLMNSGLAASLRTMAVTPPLPAPHQTFALDLPLREARDAFEKSYFEFHLAKENGSMTRVAERTGLERTHLYRKLKQLGVGLLRSKRRRPSME